MRVHSQVIAAALFWALSISAAFAQDPANGGPNFSSENASAASESYRAPNPDFGALLPKDSSAQGAGCAG